MALACSDALRIAILGSCATRDIFRVAAGGTAIAAYCCRTSLVSVMSPAVELEKGDLAWPSKFAWRMVRADFAKTFFDDLERAEADVLIVDFIEERYDLMRTTRSYVTRSWDLVESGIDAWRRRDEFTHVRRSEPTTHALWQEACSRFADALEERVPAMRVVLHGAYCVPRYRAGTRVEHFPAHVGGIDIDSTNRHLRDYYRYFARALARPPLELELPGEYLAERDHLWGLSPFHYEDRYYLDAFQALRGALGPAAPSRGGQEPGAVLRR